ncbi:MAG TPA: hypothetical protein VFK41_04610 [Nocardioidaceae bacterium]|nr:hypothetical protein [Nocardioidaceae bacterium]
MKTGTTYLQTLMLENRAQLLDAGVLFPTGPAGWKLQVDAVRDVTGTAPGGAAERCRTAWRNLHAQVMEHPGTSVVSMEFISYVDAEGAAEFVRRLEGADVDVVLGIRDTARLLPAIWQTGARNYGVRPWRTFVSELTAEPENRANAAWRRFLRVYDVPRMLDSWLAHVPRERVHVVTVPQSGAEPDLLWRRFAATVGVDPGVATQLPAPANESIGHASAELVRRVNTALGHDRSMAVHKASTVVLSDQILARRRSSETPVTGNAALRAFGARWNGVVRDAVLASGVSVSGDLDDLPLEPADGPDRLSRPTTDEVLSAAADSIEQLRTRVQRVVRRAQVPMPESVRAFLDTPPRAESWRPAEDPAAAAVQAVVDSVHALADAWFTEKSAGRSAGKSAGKSAGR